MTLSIPKVSFTNYNCQGRKTQSFKGVQPTSGLEDLQSVLSHSKIINEQIRSRAIESGTKKLGEGLFKLLPEEQHSKVLELLSTFGSTFNDFGEIEGFFNALEKLKKP